MIFDEWIKANAHLMIKSLFVFQILPISPGIEPFVVHIFPNNSGKANEHILYYWTKFQKYSSKNLLILLNMLKMEIHLNKPIVICDPLHVIKSSRYHLIKAITNAHNKDELIRIGYSLNLPSIVSKMT